ncbi:hypothetical protein BAE44_0013084 [Dichanthelium oligosanthes]|uniref:Uncharacterized protein n=1 Tax=Dichanthelium oligosanthes TaxID=888268 RepID=A0A1E5VLE3_9POAL|nr:hypothetical protein BAE44_0013084 [Dichanthelium oligosanthes]
MSPHPHSDRSLSTNPLLAPPTTSSPPPSPFSPSCSSIAAYSLLATLLQSAELMARVISSVEFGGERCCFPSYPDYSPRTAAPASPRAASPEYTPVSLRWMPGTPEHGPSATLRLGPPTPPPLRRAASPDYSPSSSPSRPASPEYTPLDRCGWRVGSPDYAPLSSPSRPASPEYTPLDRCRWRVGSPDYAPSTPTTSRAASPDYAPSTPTMSRVASPEYTPVCRLWRAAGSPGHRPSNRPPGAESPDCAPASPPRRAASPDYTPRTPPARASPSLPPPSPLVPDAESGTSSARRYRRRHHPYQRSGAGTSSASGINHGQRHLVS